MRSTPTISATEMRGINRSAILDIIRRKGPIARSDIVETLQVSLMTVIRIVDELIAEDMVKDSGVKEWTGGRRRPLLEFNSQGHVIIGVDLNESRIYGAVADLAGNIYTEITVPHHTSGSESYELLVQTIDGLLAYAKTTGKNILGIGVGALGITYYDEGVVHWAPTIEWRDFPLKENLHKRFNLPIILDNDVNLAALGETWFGVGQNCSNLVLVIIGSGIGAGIIIDGGIYRGSHLTAGEIGFLLPDRTFLGSKRDGFGALESQASGAIIAEKARKVLADRGSTENLEEISAEYVFDAYRNNEEWAKPIIEDSIGFYSQMLATLAVCFDPDVIILSGGVSKSADLLIEPILKNIEGVIPICPKILVSTLGHRATIMGAIIETLYNTSDFYSVRKLS